ncbi:DNA-directed RNA polymerase specialized sigma24 family protein [Flavobacterium sp. 28A]|uniref:hypothetical protein n=1 Tax=Flavobacterium sp. 28A TaxID=2735895 RepID=UPI00156EA2F3|nr:hypothetical protein [Flavobacterium sp. 28A]NRT15273.1 DNA-directed RNA polymerase specialized sigma24 family protein [Flavobacterium sp. 28A]
MLLNINDIELIDRIIADPNHISILYERHHKDFSQQLSSKFRDINLHAIQDIVTESILDLLEKIPYLQFEVGKDNKSLENYLFVMCRNKLYNESKKATEIQYEENNKSISYLYHKHEEDTNNNLQFEKWKQSLEVLKQRGGKCYSLIVLSTSKIYKYKISDLTRLFNYANDATTRTRKFNCLQSLKSILTEL